MSSEWTGRTRRVRAWIRICGVLVVVALAIQQASVIHYVRSGEMPASEVRGGFITIGVVAVGVWLLAFRPRVRIDRNRMVEVRNPIKTSRFDAADVMDCRPSGIGLQFRLRDGSKPWSIVFQDTAYVDEPHWFDVAEAVTGTRPKLPPEPRTTSSEGAVLLTALRTSSRIGLDGDGRVSMKLTLGGCQPHCGVRLSRHSELDAREQLGGLRAASPPFAVAWTGHTAGQ